MFIFIHELVLILCDRGKGYWVLGDGVLGRPHGISNYSTWGGICRGFSGACNFLYSMCLKVKKKKS